MRVLQLTPAFGSVGGIEVYIARLSERLIAQGHATAVVTSGYTPVEKTAYKVAHIPGFCHAEPMEMRRAEPQVLEFAAQFQPDVVLSHHTGNAPLLAALGKSYPTVELSMGFSVPAQNCSGAGIGCANTPWGRAAWWIGTSARAAANDPRPSRSRSTASRFSTWTPS